jgi:hypothetical protein
MCLFSDVRAAEFWYRNQVGDIELQILLCQQRMAETSLGGMKEVEAKSSYHFSRSGCSGTYFDLQICSRKLFWIFLLRPGGFQPVEIVPI